MIRIIAVGKIKEKYLVNMIEDYKKRINKYHKLEIIEILDNDIDTEGKKIVKLLEKKGLNIVLDIRGKQMNSVSFADYIKNGLMNNANINFIIGGSDGLSKEVLDMADRKISFSSMTFTHGMFRAIILEQIYRGFKIMNNERYHK